MNERPKEDTRGWERSSDPYMRKAAYYADMANRNADRIAELSASTGRAGVSSYTITELLDIIAERGKRIEELENSEMSDLDPADVSSWDVCVIHEAVYLKGSYCKDCWIDELEDDYKTQRDAKEELVERIAELEAALRECDEAVKYTGSECSVPHIVRKALGEQE